MSSYIVYIYLYETKPYDFNEKIFKSQSNPRQNQCLIETMAIRSSRYDPGKRADSFHGLLFPHVFQEYNSNINNNTINL